MSMSGEEEDQDVSSQRLFEQLQDERVPCGGLTPLLMAIATGGMLRLLAEHSRPRGSGQ